MLRYAITRGDLGTGGRFPPGEDASDRQLEHLTAQVRAQVRALALAGIDAVLLREKHLPPAELVKLARHLVQATRGTATRVLVAGRADVARAAGAAGVHLASDTGRAGGTGELEPAQVRQVCAGAWVTVSCHTLAEVERARRLGADAILFAPVFEKVVQEKVLQAAGTGLELLGRAVERAGPVPVLALGGVTEANTPRCLAAGAAGIAAIRLFGL